MNYTGPKTRIRMAEIPLIGRNVSVSTFDEKYRSLQGVLLPWGYGRPWEMAIVNNAVAASPSPRRMIYNSASTNIFCIYSNGKVYDITTTDPTLLSTAWTTTAAVDHNFYNDLCIITSQGQAPLKITTSNVVSALGGTPPTAAYIEIFKEYVFMARTSANVTRLFWSAVGNPESWTTGTDFVDVGKLDGGNITGLRVFLGDLYILKSSGIYKLSFTSTPGDGVITMVTPSGVLNHLTVVDSQNRFYLTRSNNNVVLFNGQTTTDISSGIITGTNDPATYYSADITPSTLMNVEFGQGQDKLFIGEVNFDTVRSYDKVLGAFDSNPIPSPFMAFTGYPYGSTFSEPLIGSSNGKIYSVRRDYRGTETEAEMNFTTGFMDFGNPSSMKKITSVYLIITSNSLLKTNNPTLTVTLTDAEGVTQAKTVNVDFANSKRSYRLDFTTHSSTHFAITASVSTNQVTLKINKCAVLLWEEGYWKGATED